jgi:hypothetical protein
MKNQGRAGVFRVGSVQAFLFFDAVAVFDCKSIALFLLVLVKVFPFRNQK